MIARIQKGTAEGTVTAPPSKSMAHRLLIGGALSGGSTVKGIDRSDDIAATLSCLRALGANIRESGDTVTLGGMDCFSAGSVDLDCNESGSTLRFMIPLCLLADEKITLRGSERLMNRSLSVYRDLCKASGMTFRVSAQSVTVKGRLQPGTYTVKSNISSQFISGLMFALPLLDGDSEIKMIGGIESEPYINMTVKALAEFGVRISRLDENTFFIKGNQRYKKKKLTVEGDYSNAAFLEAFNTIGGTVSVEGLSENTTQGDAVYREFFEKIEKEHPSIDLADCPDLAPVLMALAAAHNGAVFTGTRRLKIKESDRGEAMLEELRKFGIKVICEENRITVKKGKLRAPELPLSSHNDHRIVMALSVLCTLTGGEIYGAEAVKKSFPGFFEALGKIGIETKLVSGHDIG